MVFIPVEEIFKYFPSFSKDRVKFLRRYRWAQRESARGGCVSQGGVSQGRCVSGVPPPRVVFYAHVSHHAVFTITALHFLLHLPSSFSLLPSSYSLLPSSFSHLPPSRVQLPQPHVRRGGRGEVAQAGLLRAELHALVFLQVPFGEVKG